ncbi:MAG: hypothetical protein ABIO58_04300 [Luteimonas sp.]
MQILIQTICTRGRSLREAIANDARIERHDLQVVQQKRPGRRHGWAKLKSTLPDRHGAINLEWDADTNVLISRVVTRGKGRPHLIVGDYIDYLLARHARRIQAINVIPRD